MKLPHYDVSAFTTGTFGDKFFCELEANPSESAVGPGRICGEK